MNSLVQQPTSKYAFAVDWHRGYCTATNTQGYLTYLEAFFQASNWLTNRANYVVGGDSGNPVFALVNSGAGNELVLVAQWHLTYGDPQLESGPWHGFASGDVNATIQQMDIDELGSATGYTMGVIDLSRFPNDH